MISSDIKLIIHIEITLASNRPCLKTQAVNLPSVICEMKLGKIFSVFSLYQ